MEKVPHHNNTPNVNLLILEAVNAHGGMEVWSSSHEVTASVQVRGGLWSLVGRSILFANSRIVVRLHEQAVATYLHDGRIIRFTPESVKISSLNGVIEASTSQLREGFAATGRAPQWTDLEAGYFNSYALWKALPRDYDSASAVHQYFQNWQKAGFFLRLWQAGLAEYDGLQGVAWEWQSIDGATVKAPLAREGVGPNPTDREKKRPQTQPAGRRSWRPAVARRQRSQRA